MALYRTICRHRGAWLDCPTLFPFSLVGNIFEYAFQCPPVSSKAKYFDSIWNAVFNRSQHHQFRGIGSSRIRQPNRFVHTPFPIRFDDSAQLIRSRGDDPGFLRHQHQPLYLDRPPYSLLPAEYSKKPWRRTWDRIHTYNFPMCGIMCTLGGLRAPPPDWNHCRKFLLGRDCHCHYTAYICESLNLLFVAVDRNRKSTIKVISTLLIIVRVARGTDATKTVITKLSENTREEMEGFGNGPRFLSFVTRASDEEV